MDLHLPPCIQRCKTLFIAYSGGVDSTVLLHQLHQDFPRSVALRAIHINHQLQPEAEHWQAHCAEVCRKWEIPLLTKRIRIQKSNRKSVEQIAREMRLKIFGETLPENAIIAFGHHENDQAETVLLQLLRGGGLAAISGMSVWQKFHHFFIWRPLLRYDQSTILSYAKKHQLSWVEDQSNQQTVIRRNYLRHQVFPALAGQWPQAPKIIANASFRAQDELATLQYFLDNHLNSIRITTKKFALESIDLKPIFNLPNPVKTQMIYRWLQRNQASILWRFLQELLRQLEHSNCREFTISGSSGKYFVLHRNRQTLSLYQKEVVSTQGFFYPTSRIGAGICCEWLKGNPLNCRRFLGNEVMLINQQKRRLKTWYKKKKIPQFLRESLPLLYAGELLIGVAGFEFFDYPHATGKSTGLMFEKTPTRNVN